MRKQKLPVYLFNNNNTFLLKAEDRPFLIAFGAINPLPTQWCVFIYGMSNENSMHVIASRSTMTILTDKVVFKTFKE